MTDDLKIDIDGALNFEVQTQREMIQQMIREIETQRKTASPDRLRELDVAALLADALEEGLENGRVVG
tara:strand:- start:829 stop:1032 length:204 start_codon:yes stop_codon:yes gene_type:complete